MASLLVAMKGELQWRSDLQWNRFAKNAKLL